MSKHSRSQILINSLPGEVRVALLEAGVVQEVHIERTNESSIVGNIYRAVVTRVMPGLQAAFVDFGTERNGFIHADDVMAKSVTQMNQQTNPPTNAKDIRYLLREGQQIVVQVIKQPVAEKGARLSTKLALASTYAVYQPYGSGNKISHRINGKDERTRLENGLAEILDSSPTEQKNSVGRYILRSAANNIDLTLLAAEVNFLQCLWSGVEVKRATGSGPGCLHQEPPAAQRLIRDLPAGELTKIIVDDKHIFGQLKKFCDDIQIDIPNGLNYYSESQPLFGKYGIDHEIAKALQGRIELDNGGYLIIDQTEAMATVDVNTGSNIGRHDPEKTVYQTNLCSVTEITHQIRLRNLSGIIVIDFIDMQNPRHRDQVLDSLKRAMRGDRTDVFISKFTELGLVQIRRKRTYQSLRQLLHADCSNCHGCGSVKSVETVIFEIWRELKRVVDMYNCTTLSVRASSEVIEGFLASKDTFTKTFNEVFKCKIISTDEPLFTREQFDVIPG
ncbi:Rne/Rng family ribonuclease [Gammaproteobacteria bacterium]|nr:Rne/Rng family ribonuclease [Gammaproteobacteria bacterium]